jgi:hypothetical protein
VGSGNLLVNVLSASLLVELEEFGYRWMAASWWFCPVCFPPLKLDGVVAVGDCLLVIFCPLLFPQGWTGSDCVPVCGSLLVIFFLSAFLLVELKVVLAMGGCLLVIFVLSAFLLVELKVVLVVGGCLLVIYVLSAFLLVEL